jgi:hypothetical protein
MAFDEALAQRLRLLFGKLTDSSERHMFGGVCFMVAGKMCCGIAGRDLMVRVGPAGHEDALRRPHTRPMDFTGRPMRGFVYVAPAGLRTARELAAWVDRAVRFASSLPPRKAAKRTPRSRRKIAARRPPH